MSTSNPFVASEDEHWFVPGPRWWSGALGLFDRVAVAWTGRDAAARIVAVDRLGRYAHKAGLVPPAPAAIQQLFPWLDDDAAACAARDSAAVRFKNRAAIALLQRRGLESLARLTEPASDPGYPVADLAGGAILLAFHAGAQFGVGATMHRLRRRTMTVRNLPVGDAHERTRALRRSVDELRAGTIVIAAVDGPGGASTDALTCLGRRIVLRRGPFMLARLVRVPLIPVVARWTAGGRILMHAGEPLDATDRGSADATERHLAAATARWFEARLAEHPGDVWPYTLANFVAAPRVEATTAT
jgi:hypothetical protein